MSTRLEISESMGSLVHIPSSPKQKHHSFAYSRKTKISFKETVKVSILPAKEAIDAHRARIPPKSKPVAFSDEIWDGNTQEFRAIELTLAEFQALEPSLAPPPTTLNKFTQLISKFMSSSGDVDLVGSAVKRQQPMMDETDQADLDASIKAVPLSVNEDGEIVWGEISPEELQKRRGSVRKFNPTAPVQPRPSLNPALPLPPLEPFAEAITDTKPSLMDNRNNNKPAPPTTIRGEFLVGENRIEFVNWVDLPDHGGDFRDRANDAVEEEDLSAVRARPKSLVKRFMGLIV